MRQLREKDEAVGRWMEPDQRRRGIEENTGGEEEEGSRWRNNIRRHLLELDLGADTLCTLSGPSRADATRVKSRGPKAHALEDFVIHFKSF